MERGVFLEMRNYVTSLFLNFKKFPQPVGETALQPTAFVAAKPWRTPMFGEVNTVSLGGWSNHVGAGPLRLQYADPCTPDGIPFGSPLAHAVNPQTSPVTHSQPLAGPPPIPPGRIAPMYGPSAFGVGDESQSAGFDASSLKTNIFSASLVRDTR